MLPGSSSVRCTVPPSPGGALGSVSVTVRVDPLAEDQGTATLTYYDAASLPSVTDVRPSVADDVQPQLLRIIGRNFAPLSASMRCAFGVDGPTPASFVSPTELACASPTSTAGESHTVDLRVSVDGRRFSAPSEATFHLVNAAASPTLSQLLPHLGPAAGGSVLTLSGRGFAPAPGRLQCAFGEGLRPTAASFVSSERVRCTAPAAGASSVRSVPVSLTTAGGSPPASSSLPYVYHDPARPPTVSAVSPAFGDLHTPPSVVLHGVGFAPVGDALKCRLGTQWTAASFLTTTSIRCAAPPADALPTGSMQVTAAIDGGAALASGVAATPASAPTFLTFDASVLPVAKHVSPSWGPVAGGTLLTVYGDNLAPTPSIACVFDELGASAATLVNEGALRCATPPAAAAFTTSLALTLDHRTLSAGSSDLSFTFHDDAAPPVVLFVSPLFVPATGGAHLTLLGSNFNPAAAESSACLFSLGGTTRAMPARYAASDTFTCDSPTMPRDVLGTAQVSLYSSAAASPSQALRGQALLDAAVAAAAAAAAAEPAADASSRPPVLSTTTAPLTFYDEAAPPVLSSVVPPLAPLDVTSALATVVAVGSNFAPVGAKLLCAMEGATSIGVFLNGSAVRCALPLPSSPCQKELKLSADGGVSWSAPLPVTFYEPLLPPTVESVATPTIDVAAHSPPPIILFGSNIAPTAGLRCGFGGFSTDAGAKPVHTVATFLSATSVRCEPPSKWWSVAHLHLSHDGGAHWSARGPQIALYNTSQPAVVTSLSPAALPVDGSAGSLLLRGDFFFRPAGTADFACKFLQLPPAGADRRLDATLSAKRRQLQATASVAPATLVDGRHARCAAPGAARPHTASVALSFDGGVTAGVSKLLTFYDDEAPPHVVAAHPPDGPLDLSTLVTVSGNNFAPPASAGSLLCRFGAATAAATFVHAQAIACHAPPAKAIGAVEVSLSIDSGATWTSGEGTSTTPFVYYDPSTPPRVLSVAPAAASTAGDGKAAGWSAAKYISFSEVECVSPRVADSTTDVTMLFAAGGHTSGGTAFTFFNAAAPPTVGRIDPQGLPLGAPRTTVRVFGGGFAPVGLGCLFGEGESSTRATFITSALVLCDSPAENADLAGPRSIPIGVSRSALRSPDALDTSGSPPATFTFYDPAATPSTASATPGAVDLRGGTTILVTGAGFRPAGSDLQCTVGGLHVPAHFVSPTAVTCDTPMGQEHWVRDGASVAVCVRISGRGSNGCAARVTYFNPSVLPAVASLTPRLLPLGASDTAITVKGANFAPTGKGRLVCRFFGGESEPSPATFVAGDTLACNAPRSGVARTDAVRVSIDGGEHYSATALPFAHYDGNSPPRLTSAWPPVAGLQSRVPIKLSGSNFAPTAGFSCQFGALPVVRATFTSSTSAHCDAPLSPTVRTVGLRVSLDGSRWSASPFDFTFYDTTKPPDVRNISRAYGPLGGGGDAVVVGGSNFAPTGDGLLCKFTPQKDAGEESAEPAPPQTSPATFVSITQIRCLAPPIGIACTADISASTDGKVFGHSAAVYTYYDPAAPAHVSHVTPSFGPFSSSTTVTVYGSNFAPTTAGMHAQWGQLGAAAATFVSSSVAKAVSVLPPASQHSVSVPLELSFSKAFTTDPPAQSSWHAPSLFTYYNPFDPPTVQRLEPSEHRCGDGGRTVIDTRSGESIEVSDETTVAVTGENFAPLDKLSCVFRRTGESIFDSFEHSVPAEFISSQHVRCPIPLVEYADDGLTLSSKMFFSVSNDNAIYRYSSHIFTFLGECKQNEFTRTMYHLVYGLAFTIIFLCVALALLYFFWKPFAKWLKRRGFKITYQVDEDGDGTIDRIDANPPTDFLKRLATVRINFFGGGSTTPGGPTPEQSPQGYQRLVDEAAAAEASSEPKQAPIQKRILPIEPPVALDLSDRLASAAPPKPSASTAEQAARLATHGTLELHVLSAGGLAAKSAGYSDPYVTIKLPGKKLWKSSVQSKTLSPVWDEVMRVQGTLGEMLAAPTAVKVVDKDQLSVDESLGVLSLRLDGLLDAPASPWTLEMPSQLLIGAEAARGSHVSLRAVFVTDADAAKQRAATSPPMRSPAAALPTPVQLPARTPSPPRPTKPAVGGGASKSSASASVMSKTGMLEVHLHSASDLMAADADGYSDPYATIKMAGHKTWKSSTQQKTLNPTWDESMRVRGSLGSFLEHSLHVKVFDKDFLGMGDDRLGSARVSLAGLEMGLASGGSSGELVLQDVALADAMSGTINVTIRFEADDEEAMALAAAAGAASSVGSPALQPKAPPPPPTPSPGKVGSSAPPPVQLVTLGDADRLRGRGTLTVHLIGAEALRAADPAGYSDPYVMVRLPGQKYWKSSGVQKKTLYPQWDERLQMEGVLGDFTSGPLEIKVLDKEVLRQDDKLGRFDASLEPLRAGQDSITFLRKALLDVQTGTISFSVSWTPAV